MQLFAEGRAVASGKVSWIVLAQDADRAGYQRRDDRRAHGDGFTDNISPTLEVRCNHQQVRTSQEIHGVLVGKRTQPMVARILPLFGLRLSLKLRVKSCARVLHENPRRSRQLAHSVSGT